MTGFAREPIHVTAWPGGKKVAVSFALFVEEFGFGQGPVYRPDMTARNPDLVNEAFRQYAIDWGIPRVGRLFRELDVPLTIVLSAEFPGKYKSVWQDFRASQPNAPIVAHHNVSISVGPFRRASCWPMSTTSRCAGMSGRQASSI